MWIELETPTGGIETFSLDQPTRRFLPGNPRPADSGQPELLFFPHAGEPNWMTVELRG
jgi:hypothetical protein